jgi:hypothetical protein
MKFVSRQRHRKAGAAGRLPKDNLPRNCELGYLLLWYCFMSESW